MRKIKIEGNWILPTEAIGMPWPENHLLEGIQKRDRLAAVKIKDGVIVDYKKCLDCPDPRVFTVDLLTEETFRLCQVGTYEEPVIFRMNGFGYTRYRSKDYLNWHNYRLVALEDCYV